MKKGWLSLLLIALLAGGVAVWFNLKAVPEMPDGFAGSNGRLELERRDVGSLYAGRVEQMLVDEGDSVEAGQVLAVLARTQSGSRLKAAEAGTARAREAVARAEAGIRARTQQLRLAQMEYDNARRMRRENLISPAELSRRRAAREAAVAELSSAEAARAEALAAVQQAEAQAAAARDADGDMQIRSPVTGRVEYRLAEPGNVLGAGGRVLTLVDTADVGMAIFLPMQTAGKVRIGAEARIILDAIDAVWPATVRFVAADAQFTPKYVETATEREKLMYRVKLRIPADVARRYDGLLKGGMVGSAYVRLDTDRPWPSDWALRLPKAEDDVASKDTSPTAERSAASTDSDPSTEGGTP
ncbi:MAG: HlyD family efflux transporter periplasmic adaptor subunit [Lautropia sp.]|nr:HlyD family efflux transporter periplasmic adaptor subunit [Lautropia sp.]